MKNQNKTKKCLYGLLCLCLLPLIGIALVIGIVDPFFAYHKPLSGFHYVIDNQLEQNPGIAKQFDYDSVMLGSSMTTNFDTNLFEQALGTKMVKLSYNGALGMDIDNIMKIVTREKEGITHVFLCVDIANYLYETGHVAFPIPEHMYDRNPLNDLKYLLNKEVLLDYVVKPFLSKESTPINEIYWHWQHMEYSEEKVLSQYTKPVFTDVEPDYDYALINLKENLALYIEPYLKNMKNTQFHIFFPPYSMLYWYDSMARNVAELRIDALKAATETFLQYENVEIMYFQDKVDWITDLNNYTDTTHYSKEITDLMTEELCASENVITKENYEEKLEEFKAFVLDFDYESYFE